MGMADVQQPRGGSCNLFGCICWTHVFPQRYCMTVMMMTCFVVAYMQRVGLNLAIVAMVKETVAEPEAGHACPAQVTVMIDTSFRDELFDWDETTQSYILLSFYFGYMIGNVFSGYLVDSYGARWFVFGGQALSTIGCGIIPPLAYYTHWSTIVIARVVAGVGQATLYPGVSNLIARWIPDEQKASISAMTMTSFALGTMVGNGLTGYIIKATRTWCWVYYAFGAVGVVWMVFFYIYVFSTPASHPRISPAEFERLKVLTVAKRSKIPLKQILSDLVVWTILIGQFGNDYTLYVIITNMPKYYTTVLNMSTYMTGIFLIAPIASCFVGSLIFGFAGDLLVGRGILKHVHFRIIATLLAMPVAGLCMIMVTYMECDYIMATVFLCLAMLCKSGFFCGLGVSALDLSLNYAGIIFGLSNVTGSVSGMIAPYIIAKLAGGNTLDQWMLVHYVSLAICIVALLPYLMFIKGSRRDWDYEEGEAKEKKGGDEVGATCGHVWSCYKPE